MSNNHFNSKMLHQAGEFSRLLKIEKLNFLQDSSVNHTAIDNIFSEISLHNLMLLTLDNEKISYWINIYNGFTNYIIVKKNIRKSIGEKPYIFMWPKIKIGRYKLSLDDIEHGILRKNRKASHKFWRQFSYWSKKRTFVVNSVDPRIHFALNCGAKSCPPIAFYNPKTLSQQLEVAKENFVENEFLVNHDREIITCSKLFFAFQTDFQGLYLNDPALKGYKVIIKPYDWSVI